MNDVKNSLSQNTCTVTGTMKVHVTPQPTDMHNNIFVRDMSCFWADCFSGSFSQNAKCDDGWSKRSLTKSNVNPHKGKIPVPRENLLFEVGDFVTAAYLSDCQVYIWQIKAVSDNVAFILFLKHSGKLCDRSIFLWPKSEDEVWKPRHDILCVTLELQGKKNRVHDVLIRMFLTHFVSLYRNW